MNIRSYIRTSSLTAKRLKRVFEKAEVYPSRNASSLMPYAFLNKAFQVHESVLILCKQGFGSEAYALSRILVETFIALRWITNTDQANRARQYGFFVDKRKEYLSKVAAKYFPNDTAWKVAEKEWRATVRTYSNRYSSFHFWANLPEKLRGMASEQEKLEVSPPAQENAMWTYEFPYSLASDHVHATILAVDRLIPEVGVPFRVSGFQSKSDTEDAIFTSTTHLWRIALRIDAALHLDLLSKIEEVFVPFAKISRHGTACDSPTRL